VGLSLHVLGLPTDDNAPAALVFKMPPNFELPRHAHVCQRFEIVVEGSIQVGDRTLHPGDIMTAEPDEPYGPHIAGPEGCTTLEVFSTLRGAYVILFDTPDGLEATDFSDPAMVEAVRALTSPEADA
jgi:anti-sigma factor ChrR (cupin superfamily)